MSSSLLPIASIVLEILGLLIGAVIVGIFIIIVVANRAEPDETGNRPQSVYYFAVSFVALVTTILGSVVVVFSVVELIGRHSPGIGNAIARAVVIGGLITVLSGALLWTTPARGGSGRIRSANPRAGWPRATFRGRVSVRPDPPCRHHSRRVSRVRSRRARSLRAASAGARRRCVI